MDSSALLSKTRRALAKGRLIFVRPALWKTGLGILLLLAAVQVPARDKNNLQWGAGLIVNVPFPENEVTQVVQDVVQDGIIRGTKEYNKDEYVMGATTVSSTRVFSEKVDNGKVFYKIRLKALDPRNFKDGGDVGTLAVRYVVQPQGTDHTVLRIDARFVEDFRRVSHASNGSVESSEYKDIHDRLDAIELMKSQTAEAEKEQQAARQKMAASRTEAASQTQPAETAATVAEVTSAPAGATATPPVATPLAAPPASTPLAAPTSPSAPAAASGPPPVANAEDLLETLEAHVKDLRRQVQRRVKAPGAALKSAPFHTSSTLQSLPPATEVLIVVATPYWYGVETHEGQHGWMLRDDLEVLP